MPEWQGRCRYKFDDVGMAEFGKELEFTDVHWILSTAAYQRQSRGSLTLAEMFSKLGDGDFATPILANIHAVPASACIQRKHEEDQNRLFETSTPYTFEFDQQIRSYDRVFQTQLLEIQIQFGLAGRLLAVFAMGRSGRIMCMYVVAQEDGSGLTGFVYIATDGMYDLAAGFGLVASITHTARRRGSSGSLGGGGRLRI